MKERIQKKLEVADKEFDKYRFALVSQSTHKFVPEEADWHINLQDIRPKSGAGEPRPPPPL